MGDTPGYRWGGLVLGRSLRPAATFITPGGHIREIPLTNRQLIGIIKDAAHALGQREDAADLNFRREQAQAEGEKVGQHIQKTFLERLVEGDPDGP